MTFVHSGLEAFVARPSRTRIALMIFGSLAFVALGLWIAGFFGPPPRPDRVWAGYAAILFFGLAALIGIRRLFESGDQIVVDGSGICWSQWSDRKIPWSEIREISRKAVKRQQFLCLDLVDATRHPPTSLLGGLAGTSRLLGFGDIAINVSGTDRKFEELVEAVERFRPAR
jgi:hypothetical protein